MNGYYRVGGIKSRGRIENGSVGGMVTVPCRRERQTMTDSRRRRGFGPVGLKRRGYNTRVLRFHQ